MIAAAASSMAGAGVSAYGMVQQGRAARQEANYNAKIEENNAISAGYAAIQEQQAAQREADSLRDERIRALASQRTAVAASGLMLSGSALDVMGDTALESEKEIQMALYRGRIGSYNQTQQAANFRNRAVLTRMAGKNAARSYNMQAAGTFLSSAASTSSGYASFKKGSS